MDLRDDSAAKVAEFLLQIKAIELNPEDPFKWSSGWLSPIYCDNRKTLSYPKIRTFIRQQFVETIQEQYGKPDLIAGVATGGIAQGVLVAQEMGIPFAYIRPQPKEHGRKSQIEGVVENGWTVVVIEDLISTGNSSLSAVQALREAGVTVKGMAAIFSYGFRKADERFEEAKCPLITLSDYSHLIREAVKRNYIPEKMIATLEEWSQDPDAWTRQYEADHN